MLLERLVTFGPLHALTSSMSTYKIYYRNNGITDNVFIEACDQYDAIWVFLTKQKLKGFISITEAI